MTTPQQQVLDKCKAVLATASALYSMDLSHVSIRFDLKGRAAGMACQRGAQMYMRFNRDMLTREAFDHVINNTVPHEIAHIVCFKNPSLGRGHDSGWERVCVRLGGSGATRHKEDVVYGKGTTYEYTTTTGHKVRLSEQRHRGIQSGNAIRWKHGMGITNQTCAYSIVGIQGRTLATPIVKKEANHPAVIEAAVRAPVAPIVQQARTSFTIGTAPVTPKPTFAAGVSKAAVARAIMLAGRTQGQTHDAMIAAIMLATGHDRQLARATFKANAAKVGITL